MPYSIKTQDGILIRDIPDNIPRDSDQLRQRVVSAREQRDSAPKVEDQQTVNELPTPPVESTEQQTQMKTPGIFDKFQKGLVDNFSQFQKGIDVQTRELGDLLRVNQTPSQLDVKDPEGFLQTSSRMAGEVIAPSPAMANIPGAAFAATAGGKILSKGLSKLSPIVKPLLAPIAKAANKGIGFVGEILSSVPTEFIEKAIKREVAGDSLFKGKKKSFNELGIRAQKAMNHVFREAGKEVGEEKKALINKKVLIGVDDFIKSIDDKIAEKTMDEISTLDKKDIKTLTNFKNALKGGVKKPILDEKGKVIGREIQMDAAKLNLLKKKMQNQAKFSLETVSKASDEAKGILKSVSGEIADKVNTKIPELGAVNKRFSKLADLKSRLATDLKDKSVARNVRNLVNKDEFTKNLFKELDEAAPDHLKFFNDIEDTFVRQAFDQIFPGRGGGSGGAQGVANILRVAGVSQTGGLTAPLVSPLVQQGVIRTPGVLGRAAKTRAGVESIAKLGLLEENKENE